VKRKIKQLNAQKLHDLTMAYVARFATSTGKLQRYLEQKIRTSEWTGDEPPRIDALIEKCCALGLIDDKDFAERKTQSLARRGYGPARVRSTLRYSGINENLSEETLSNFTNDPDAMEQAALVYAKKRKFGPFAMHLPSPMERQKQTAAMLRAGHTFEIVRKILALRE
jgi:regulatory protein